MALRAVTKPNFVLRLWL